MLDRVKELLEKKNEKHAEALRCIDRNFNKKKELAKKISDSIEIKLSSLKKEFTEYHQHAPHK